MVSLRILVVEDDPLMGELLAEMLEEMGHHVCALAANEADAVQAARDHNPDLMIVDVQLGTGSGIAATEEILQSGPVPHFFMSGEKSPATRPGATVLLKPFLEAELAAAIERISISSSGI